MKLRQTIKFRFYNSIRYLSDLTTINIANTFHNKQPLSIKFKPIKLLMASDDKCYTSEQQFAPFLTYRQQLRQKFGLALNQMLITDVLNLPTPLISSYDIIFVKLDFKTPKDEVKRTIQQLNEVKGTAKLVYFDGDDDAYIQWNEVLRYVDLYVKKSLLVDTNQYEKVCVGKSNLTDYVARQWRVSFSDNIIPASQPIKIDGTDSQKIFLGCNIGMDDKIRTLYLENANKQSTFKEYDILCRASIPEDWMGYLRRDIIPELEKMGSNYKVLIPNKKVTQQQYYEELRGSKICVSPFGYGEICWRDFEAVLCQCLLIKPDMSHIKTEPNIFVPYETYVPVKWDLSDLQEKCFYYLHHEDERQRIVDRAYKVLSDYYNNEKFLSVVENLLKKLNVFAC